MMSASDFSNDTCDVLCLGELEDEIGIEDMFYHASTAEPGDEGESGSVHDDNNSDFLACTFFKTETSDQDLKKLPPSSNKENSRKKRRQGTHGHQVL